jgi:GxxExxY protein
MDLVVADCVSAELKAVEKLNSVHDARLLPHLDLARCRAGSRLNLHCTMLKDGIRGFANDFPSSAISAVK